MSRFNFKKLQNSWKHLVALFVMIGSISIAALLMPSNHPANAFLGIGDVTITLIDIKAFAEDLLESFAETITEGIVKQVTSNAINSVVSQYHIGSYLQYAANLKNQVFVAQAISNDGLAGQNQMNQYIVKSIITDIDNNPVSRISLDPLYQQAATTVFDINSVTNASTGASAQSFLARGGSFSANPGGQYLMYMDLSEKINTKAYIAAQQDIATASGNKSSYNCTAAAFAAGTNLTADNGQTVSQSLNNNKQINCALQNPGNYVGTVLAGNINGLYSRAINPPNNHLSAIAGAIGAAFAGIAQQQLIGGSNGGTLITSSATAQEMANSGSTSSGSGNLYAGLGGGIMPTLPSTPPPVVACGGCAVHGESTSNYGTLYALDSSGNVIAGSGTSQSNKVANKSSYTIEWNAGAVIGASYVAFAPCSSSECSGSKDKKQLDGSFSAKASGVVKTYTIQVWGMDGHGNTTILETDSIAIKTK